MKKTRFDRYGGRMDRLQKTWRVGLWVTLAGLTAGMHGQSVPSTGVGGQTAAGTPQLQMRTLGAATQADPFPAVNPANFTADSPSVATVDAYLHAMLGSDVNRIWRVAAIQKTATAGVSRVTVLVSERAPNAKVLRSVFFVMPDGKHLIAQDSSGMNPFSAKPFAESRDIAKVRAGGPAKGASTKDLLLLEFADLQCERCKEAQATIGQLENDFPMARIVYEDLPAKEIHPYAMQAALYGACVAKKSSEAFFTYASAVYDAQAGLTAEAYDATLKAAVTKAGMDPSAVALCAATDAAKSDVNAVMTLASELGVEQTPALVVNGRPLPLVGIPYETLKKLIAFQAAEDGVPGASAASGLTLKQR